MAGVTTVPCCSGTTSSTAGGSGSMATSPGSGVAAPGVAAPGRVVGAAEAPGVTIVPGPGGPLRSRDGRGCRGCRRHRWRLRGRRHAWSRTRSGRRRHVTGARAAQRSVEQDRVPAHAHEDALRQPAADGGLRQGQGEGGRRGRDRAGSQRQGSEREVETREGRLRRRREHLRSHGARCSRACSHRSRGAGTDGPCVEARRDERAVEAAARAVGIEAFRVTAAPRARHAERVAVGRRRASPDLLDRQLAPEQRADVVGGPGWPSATTARAPARRNPAA